MSCCLGPRSSAPTSFARGSSPFRQFVDVYHGIRQPCPGRRILVFAQFLRFLKAGAEVLKREADVEPLGYDGAMTAPSRCRRGQSYTKTSK
jgi:hypothetical protein